MILKGVEASRYCAKPAPAHSGLLIFGADPMRVALKRQEAIAALIGPDQLRWALKKSSVRPQASCAAAASKRGVVSLLKPCWVPGYWWAV